MILDHLDILILRKFYKLKKGKDFSIWNWAKKEFPGMNKREKVAKYNLIITRIKRMPFFETKSNGEEQHILDSKKIKPIKKYLQTHEDILISFDGNFTVYKKTNI